VGADVFDPYHAPVAYSKPYTDSPVSLEWFFPVSAPHRPRSEFFLRNDPASTGDHAPFLLGTPQLFVSGAPLATQGTQAIGNPIMVPTDTPFVDPSVFANPTTPNPLGRLPILFVPDAGPDGAAAATVSIVGQSSPSQLPSVRFAWEDPVVQVDQDWTVTYEGPLPGFFDNGGNPLVLANVLPRNGLPNGGTSDGAPPDFSAAWLQNKDAYFCSKGIEDYSLGTQRAQSVTAAVQQTIPGAGGVSTDSYAVQVADYVQLTDDVLPNTDPYWNVPNTCWDEVNDPTLRQNQDPNQRVQSRNNYCNEVFGQTLDPTTPSLQRDFPIIEAHDDKLLIGRFGYRGPVAAREPGSPSWAVVGPDPTNAKVLALMQCCFHNQIHFNVRTGGEWVANGSRQGLLHHIVATGADARCETSCEPRDVLLNARTAPIPRPPPGTDAMGKPVTGCDPTQITPPSITRDSVLALRNPMFSFFIWNGQVPAPTPADPNACADRPPARDTEWTFSTRGGFTPQLLNLASNSGISPQAMRFIDSLGQLAVIDGASQGLMLIDLNSLTLAHAPYF
jgi:hypothetical protein